jgi:3-hydroxyisobutyrate dehydrogenase
MVGGGSGTFERVKPLREAMGKNIVHCGGVGTGQIAKICNNLVLGITMAGVSEAMSLGAALGIDPKTLSGILNTSTGRCWSSDTYKTRIPESSRQRRRLRATSAASVLT